MQGRSEAKPTNALLGDRSAVRDVPRSVRTLLEPFVAGGMVDRSDLGVRAVRLSLGPSEGAERSLRLLYLSEEAEDLVLCAPRSVTAAAKALWSLGPPPL